MYSVTGSGFLRHMVRAIVGTLVEVGSGRSGPDRMDGCLRDGSRRRPDRRRRRRAFVSRPFAIPLTPIKLRLTAKSQ